MRAALIVIVVKIYNADSVGNGYLSDSHVFIATRVSRKQNEIRRVGLKGEDTAISPGKSLKQPSKVSDVRSDVHDSFSGHDCVLEQFVCLRLIKPGEHIELPSAYVVFRKGKAHRAGEGVRQKIKRRVNGVVQRGKVNESSVEYAELGNHR